jgi:hypothetical protein
MNRLLYLSLLAFAALCSSSAIADDHPNNTEGTARLVVFAPGGPLLIELQMTIDGEPFRRARTRLIDELLKQADVDGDGKSTWVEAMINPRFAFGRFAGRNRSQVDFQESTIKRNDRNKNGQVDRDEAEYLIAQFTGDHVGGACSVARAYSPARQQPDLFRLLDTDNDKKLSADELEAASARLKSRDADDNEAIDAGELTGTEGRRGSIQTSLRSNRRAVSGGIPARMLLAEQKQMDQLYQQLIAHYGGKNKKLDTTDLAARADLAKQLDANDDGRIDMLEIEALHSLPASIVLVAHFGDVDKRPRGLILKSLAKSLGPREKTVSRSGKVTTLHLPGMKLQFSAVTFGDADSLFDQVASQTLTRMDTNNNGYVELKELTGNFRGMLTTFRAWDADGDEKVYPKELVAFYVRQQIPQTSRIVAWVHDQGNSVFATLDVGGEGRIGLREMRGAAERLRSFDSNKDGSVAAQEIPHTVSIRLARGGNRYAGYGVSTFARSRTMGPPPADAGPAWFVRMDRNIDGDLTMREFLGTAAQFKQLDTDGDDFITRAEAEKATDVKE